MSSDVEQWTGAKQRYDHALALDPNQPAALFGRGEASLMLGEPAEALPFLQRAAQLDPDNAACWRTVGVALCQCGEVEDGLIAFEAGLECDTTDEETYILIAHAKFRLLQFDEVVQFIRAMPMLMRHRPDLIELLLTSLLLLERVGDLPPVVEQAFKLFPNDPDVLALAGAAATRAGRNDQASALLTRAITIDPDNYDAFVGLATNLIMLDRNAAAHALALKAHAISPERFEAPLLLASLALLARDLQAVEDRARIGILGAPLHPTLLYLLSIVLANKGSHDAAAQLIAAAAEIDPRNQAAQFALARIYLRRRDLAGSQDQLRRTIAIDPRTAQGRKAMNLLRQIG